MEEDKVSGLREGEEVFVSYREDNDTVVSGFVILLKITDTLLTFKTNRNVVSIPISRLLKIKQKENGDTRRD